MQRLISGADDFEEVGLQRGTAHEETVDVWHVNEVASVLGADRATILYASSTGYLLRYVLLEPVTDEFADFLRNLRRGDLASTNGPDGLVGDDDAAPVLDRGLEALELGLEDVVGGVSLALLQRLADAHDGVQADILGLGDLAGDHGVGLAVERAALGVADEDPVDVEVLQLLTRDLAGVSTLASLAHVLTSHLDVGVQQGLDGGDVHRDGRDEHLHLALVEGGLVEHLVDEGLGRLDGAVALPVSADNQFALCRFCGVHRCFAKRI